jgi:hypothetical protein
MRSARAMKLDQAAGLIGEPTLSRREETDMSTTSQTEMRELDRRINDGFDVRLLWNSLTGRVFVALEDERQSDSIEFEVPAADALAAFQHPFAYAMDVRHARSLALDQCRAAGCGEE